MKKLIINCSIIFLGLLCIYFFLLVPHKYKEEDLYTKIQNRGIIKVGINIDSKPFGFLDNNKEITGYDVELARYLAQYILKSPNAVEFHPVTPANRMLKVSTGEVDMVIATMTINPQREEVIDFSIPYDVAGQALLVKSDSKITSIADLSGLNVGVIFGTTAERNMQLLSPTSHIIGFRNYKKAYTALKKGKIDVLTSDDTILNRFAYEDKTVKLLSKRYTREPYGIAFRKDPSTKRLKNYVDFALTDMLNKNVILRIHRKWLPS